MADVHRVVETVVVREERLAPLTHLGLCEVPGFVCVGSLVVHYTGYVLSKNRNEVCQPVRMLFNCTTRRKKGSQV